MTDHIQGQPHDRTALILYGSETGNSQEAAEQLGRVAERLRFVTKVVEMNDVELSSLSNNALVIFTISTTGQGDIPTNARVFWRSLLRKRLPANFLHHVRFTTFGFGDSSYVKFNWAVRKLHKRLEQLGAQEVYPRGEADEQHPEGTDGTFLSWSLDLKFQLLEKYPLPDGLLPIPDSELLPPKWTLEIANGSSTTSESNSTATMDGPITGDPCIKEPPVGIEELEIFDNELPPPDLLPIPHSITAIVQQNSALTPHDHWQNVRHISLLVDKKIPYRPGGTIAIYPKNFPSDVDSLIQLMDWTADADKPLAILPTPGSSYLSPTFLPSLSKLPTTTPPTLRSLLTNNLDITSIPRRFFFEVISKFTSDPLHRSRLLEFTNPAYSDEFYDYTSRPRRSILEVLHDFPSVRLPWRWAPSIFPVLQPRLFSICSGGVLKHPNDESTVVQICVAVVKYRTVLKKVRQGVCSRYLASLQPGTSIKIVFHHGVFNFSPQVARKPVVMIAPGTGVAPMRSLIYERALWRATGDLQDPGQAVLIFGGRNAKKDFLYNIDWSNRELDVKVLTAWSRDQKEKVYVQDVIRKEAEMIWRLLVEGGGSVFVCGSSGKMPVGVRKAIIDAIEEVGKTLDYNFRRDRAEEEVVRMETEGRYWQETW